MLENNNYYFYHNDHLGTPQKMTDETGNVVWSATYTAFGEATIDAGSTITNNLRFAGQYLDSETGNHYNLNRYYDPKTGRYLQVDPIGFNASDINLYRYVFNSPITYTDPWGLQSSPKPPPLTPSSPTVYGTPTTVNPNTAPNLGTLLIQTGMWGNWFLSIDLMNQIECALWEEGKSIPWDAPPQDYTVRYGTKPLRFIGISKADEKVYEDTDWKKHDVKIQGTKGLDEYIEKNFSEILKKAFFDAKVRDKRHDRCKCKKEKGKK